MQKEHVICRNYRNRRIGDLLKELDLTEGRNTGFPKIYREVRRNGSPMPIFETDERNMHFMVTLPIHEMFLTEEGDVVEPVVEVGIEQLTERQYTILRLIGKSVAEGVVETAESMARKLKVSSRTVQRELSRLQKMKRLRRKGADSNGDWEVLGRM